MPKNQTAKKKKDGQKINFRTLSILSIFAFLFFFTLVALNQKNDFKVASKYYPLPRQYSDSKITKQAKILDKEYSHIGFNDSTLKKSKNLASVLEPFESIFGPKEKPINKVQEKGTWIWTPILEMTDSYVDSIIQKAKKEDINTIYISIDSYLDIFALSKDKTKNKEKIQKKNDFINRIEYIIKKAKESGIEIDAEAGWRNWAEDGHEYKPYTIVEFVKRYNSTHKEGEKFRGIQYDVEPYLLENYNENKDEILKRFLSLIKTTSEYIKDDGIHFSVVIPEFYDAETDEYPTPRFLYDTKYGATFDHLLSIMSEIENTSIIIMSYRNFAEGEDGSIDISNIEMQKAKSKRFDTKIILAQETGNVLPHYVTFFNTSKKQFETESNKLISHFEDNPSFGGIAIHYANAFMELK